MELLRKCWNCREEYKDNGNILCEKCEQNRDRIDLRGTDTLVFYDKM